MSSHKQIKHIVWDWNGTLFDDAELCQVITRKLLRRAGVTSVSVEAMQRAFTHPVRDIYLTLGADFSIYPFENLAADFMEAYISGTQMCKIRPEARGVIDRLRQRGIGHSILSAVSHSVLVESVEAQGLSHFFEQVLGLDDHYATSKVENGGKLLARLGLSGSEVLVVGDTTHDVEAAEALGAPVVLIPSGYQHVEILEKSSAPLLSCLSDVEEHLCRIMSDFDSVPVS